MTVYAENILVCIAFPMLVSLLFIRGSARQFVSFFVTGMVVCLLSAYINGFFAICVGANPEETSVFMAPVTEAAMQLMPLVFLFLVFNPTEKEIFFSAVAVGIGFATFENCCYILSDAVGSFSYIMVRGTVVGVMHLVCTTSMGFGLILEKRFPKLSFAGVLGILALASTFHAVYNLLVSEPGIPTVVGYILPCFAAFALYLFHKKMKEYS